MVSTRGTHDRPFRFLGALLLSSGLLLGALLAVGHAQITLDGSLGPQGLLAGPHYRIGADVGQLRGSNLFHSFGEFNVSTGGSATFTGPAGVTNILSRVTGGQPSSIDGVLRSKIDGANLYLLNPSGVLLGPNARPLYGALQWGHNQQFSSRRAGGISLRIPPAYCRAPSC